MLGDGRRILPAVWDAASARAALSAGARSLFLSGSALAASFGLPDEGLVPAAELLSSAQRIVEAADLPLIVDAECGFDGGDELSLTARAFRRLGASGVLLEDQEFTGQSVSSASPGLCSIPVMVERIRTVREATGGELGLLARTDVVGAEWPIEATLERLERYRDAGATWLTAVFVRSREELAAVAAVAPGRFIAIAVPGVTGYLPTPAEAFETGCAGVVVTGFLQAIFPQLQRFYRDVLGGEIGRLRSAQPSRAEFAREIGFDRRRRS